MWKAVTKEEEKLPMQSNFILSPIIHNIELNFLTFYMFENKK